MEVLVSKKELEVIVRFALSQPTQNQPIYNNFYFEICLTLINARPV